jgi:hypothetical protein
VWVTVLAPLLSLGTEKPHGCSSDPVPRHPPPTPRCVGVRLRVVVFPCCVAPSVRSGGSGAWLPTGTKHFVFSETSKAAFGSAKPRIQQVPGIKRWGREADRAGHLVPSLGMSGAQRRTLTRRPGLAGGYVLPSGYPSARPGLGITIRQWWSCTFTPSICPHGVNRGKCRFSRSYLELRSVFTVMKVPLSGTSTRTACCSVDTIAAFTSPYLRDNFHFPSST